MPDGSLPDESADWNRLQVAENRGWLYAMFVAATGDPSAADDLVQQTFLVALTNQHRFDANRQMGPWLRGIAKNLLHEHWRERRSAVRLESVENAFALAQEAEPPADEASASQREAALQGCLEQLSERARRLLTLRYHDGRDSRAIGDLLAMTRESVDMAISRARHALRLCLERKV